MRCHGRTAEGGLHELLYDEIGASRDSGGHLWACREEGDQNALAAHVTEKTAVICRV